MIAHEVFALISGRDVMNIVVGEYYDCDQAAKAEYGASSFAVDATQYPVEIGDHYLNGRFYRIEDGQEVDINPVPTEADEIASLNAALNDVELALVELYEGGI